MKEKYNILDEHLDVIRWYLDEYIGKDDKYGGAREDYELETSSCDFEVSINVLLIDEELEYIGDYVYHNFNMKGYYGNKYKPKCSYCETCFKYDPKTPYYLELF